MTVELNEDATEEIASILEDLDEEEDSDINLAFVKMIKKKVDNEGKIRLSISLELNKQIKKIGDDCPLAHTYPPFSPPDFV